MSERRGSADTTLHTLVTARPLVFFVSGSNEPIRSPVFVSSLQAYRQSWQQKQAYPNKAFSLYDSGQNDARR
jgi:hypothetical protein